MLYTRLLSILGIAIAVAAAPSPQAKGKGSKGSGAGENGSCTKFEVIFARGSTEPPGYGLAGTGVVKAIEKEVEGAKGYAVEYPASANFAASVPKGVADIVNRLNRQSKACPDKKFAVGGYSQGATITHMALSSKDLDKSVFPKILALIMFGDYGFRNEKLSGFDSVAAGPPIPAELRSKVRQNCTPRDVACDPSGGDLQHHMSYDKKGSFQKDTVAFVVAAFEGKPLPKSFAYATDPGWKTSTTGTPV